MSKLCNRFNRYQDGELCGEEREQFLRHMSSCDRCRNRHYFLNNLANTIKNRKLPEPKQNPDQIAHIAYSRLRSWDRISLYLPKPATAWTTFAFLLVLFLFVWIAPSTKKPGINDKYEMLITESDLNNLNQNILIAPTDEELIRWLEQGGEIQ